MGPPAQGQQVLLRPASSSPTSGAQLLQGQLRGHLGCPRQSLGRTSPAWAPGVSPGLRRWHPLKSSRNVLRL